MTKLKSAWKLGATGLFIPGLSSTAGGKGGGASSSGAGGNEKTAGELSGFPRCQMQSIGDSLPQKAVRS